MARYNPPTRVVTVQKPWLALVNQADPEYARSRRNEVDHITSSGRSFKCDPLMRGAYNRRSNVYAVGQPYGVADAAITAALAPTVGVVTPGLFEGVDDGAGWA